MLTCRALAVTVALSLTSTTLPAAAQQVTLPNGGVVSGTFQTSATGYRIQVFRGIPYAEPPVGERRWKQATLKPLDGSVSAIAFGKICYGDGRVDSQSSTYPASEDCLFLNVYTPANATKESKLPVMVWIHGGGFVAGASNIYEGSNIVGAAHNNLIVVTLNYRLSVFGLLSGDALKRAGTGVNYALRDQEVAFQWVQQYISLFGGDVDNITAFGESAGAKSVFAHLISRGGRQQLFHRAIMQSGTYTTAHTVPTKAQQHAVFSQIAMQVGCDTTAEDQALLSCLRAANTSIVWGAGGLLDWQPVVDGVFLLDTPLTSLMGGKISEVPTIIGTNSDEGWLMSMTVKSATEVLPFVHSQFPLVNEAELARLETLYPPEAFASPTHRAAEIYGDAIYVCPSERVSLTLAEMDGKTFRYRFNQTSTTFGFPLAVHTAELRYVFNIVAGLAPDAATRSFVATIQQSWTAFAATGSPSAADASPPNTCVDNSTGDREDAIDWPLYSASQRQQVVLQSSGFVVETTGDNKWLHDERCALWGQIEQRLAPALAEA